MGKVTTPDLSKVSSTGGRGIKSLTEFNKPFSYGPRSKYNLYLQANQSLRSNQKNSVKKHKISPNCTFLNPYGQAMRKKCLRNISMPIEGHKREWQRPWNLETRWCLKYGN